MYAVNVAPLAGAWIEIVNTVKKIVNEKSLPSRGRGLKYGIWKAQRMLL